MVQESLVSLGWKENFNGGGLEGKNKEGWKNINKGYRKIYFKGFVAFFKKPKNFALFLLCSFFYYSISELFTRKQFFIFSTVIFALPVLLFLIENFKIYKMKLGKSIHKDYGLNYMIFSFFIFNIFFQFMKNDNDFISIPAEYHNLILLIIVPIHLVLSYSGYQVYVKAITRVENMRKQLLQ